LRLIIDNGDAYVWGAGDSGALGIGETDSQWFPVKINIPNERAKVHMMNVSCGAHHTGFLDGKLSSFKHSRERKNFYGWKW
jgi:alpha-tubulin suppressor-like RCC1 family protein